MVSRWFSVTVMLAMAVLVMVADASQARERRLLGRRARNRGEVVYAPVYTEEGVVAADRGGRRAFYPPNGQPVLLEVRVAPEAELWIDGTKTMQKGAVRQFISPPIEPARHYAYKIEAKWMENGSQQTRTATKDVHAGQRVMVDLTKPAETKQ